MASSPKIQRVSEHDSGLQNFLSWCEENEFNLNKKVTVVRGSGSVAEYGMIAIDNLAKGEELFRIPRDVLLHPGTSAISKTLDENCDKLKSNSGWVPLLIVLMYEYSCDNSKWRPYLNLCIHHHIFNLPMFWSSENLSMLKGTGIIEAVNRDLINIENEFTNIVVPFVKEHADIFNEAFTLELYKKMVAFVMSYSFTEPADDFSVTSVPPMMAPMADMLNHVSKNNACLEFGKEYLKMVTTCEVHSGEEVFNTYGELSNWQLLHLYGFAEEPSQNLFDVVEFSANELFKQAKSLPSKIDLLEDKIELLGMDEIFVLGHEGILTEDEIHANLKVLFLSAEDFKSYKENDGWTSDDEEEDNFCFDFEDLKILPHSWRVLLKSVATECLKRYDEVDVHSAAGSQLLGSSEYAYYVKDGQKKLLQKLINSLPVENKRN